MGSALTRAYMPLNDKPKIHSTLFMYVCVEHQTNWRVFFSSLLSWSSSSSFHIDCIGICVSADAGVQDLKKNSFDC